MRHLAQLALAGGAAPAFALPSSTPGGQMKLQLLLFRFRAHHARLPPPTARRSILLGERFSRGGLTLRLPHGSQTVGEAVGMRRLAGRNLSPSKSIQASAEDYSQKPT